jgi:isochorismate hydrolase
MRISRFNSAAIMIDIQEKLLPAMQDKETLIRNCIMLTMGLQELKIPLYVTQQYTRGLGETVPALSSLIRDYEYFEKRDFSCCGTPDLMVQLQTTAPKNVLLYGIELHVCVLQTAIDIKEAGFVPVIVIDATSSRSSLNFDLAKERLRHEGVMMTSVESILFELTETSVAEEFKAISKLVK